MALLQATGGKTVNLSQINSLVTLTLYATSPTKVNTGVFAFGNRQCNPVIVWEDGETPLVGNALKRHKIIALKMKCTVLF